MDVYCGQAISDLSVLLGGSIKAMAENKEPVKQLVRIEVLSQFVGVTVRRIQQLQQEGIIKPETGGGSGRQVAMYDFLPCVRNIIAYYRDKADSRRSGDSDEMAEEKLRQIAAKRELDEIKLQKARSEVFDVILIERVFGAMLTRLRTGLLSLPMGIAPLLREQGDINTIAGVIHERLERAMSELSAFNFEDFKATGGAEFIAELEAEENKAEAIDAEA